MTKLFLRCLSIFAFIIIALVFQFANAGVIPFAFWQKHGATLRAYGAPVSVTSTTSMVLQMPSNIVGNDLLYAFVATFDIGSAAATTTPSGWTLVGTQQFNTNMYIINVYRRIATGSDGSSVTFNFTQSVTWAQGVIVDYSPANTSTPEDVTPVFSVGNNPAPSTSVTATGVTTVSAATTVLYVAFSERRASPSWTPPPGFTTRITNVDLSQSPQSQSLHLADRLYLSPQSTGPLTSDGWDDPTNARYLIVVLPIRSR